jgi:hypothetical protein
MRIEEAAQDQRSRRGVKSEDLHKTLTNRIDPRFNLHDPGESGSMFVFYAPGREQGTGAALIGKPYSIQTIEPV